MIVDVLYIVVLAMAVIKGLKNGLILGVFSLLAIVVGLLAALKFSAVVASWLGAHTDISAAWLPFIAFIIVLLGTMWLVRWVAGMIEASAEMVMLGWANKAGGVILYMILYTLIFSIIQFYAVQLRLINESHISSSRTYSFVEPWGPAVINRIGTWIPLFKDLFRELEDFFRNLA